MSSLMRVRLITEIYCENDIRSVITTNVMSALKCDFKKLHLASRK